MKILLLTAGAVVMFVIANSLAASYGDTKRWQTLAICAVAATLAYVFFGKLSALQGLGLTSAVVDVLIVLGSVAVGALLRGERLTTMQTVGIVLGTIATVFLCLPARTTH